ncbi:hypothetical protein CVT24_001152 [Panaeolus cyanescens]|uniref:Uncharacterized protein n=1 Tax=Panaeolus cyanescens TaxID=181874 RepID=A0A409W6U0_9AGAR|nr:hypothetical protein CVT24_001152 [Panaeolus cyanescens]
MDFFRGIWSRSNPSQKPNQPRAPTAASKAPTTHNAVEQHRKITTTSDAVRYLGAPWNVKNGERFLNNLNQMSEMYNMYFSEYGNYQEDVVQEIRWYKNTKGFQSEFVMIKVEVTFSNPELAEENAPKKKIVYLRLERDCNPSLPPKKLTPEQIFSAETLQSPVSIHLTSKAHNPISQSYVPQQWTQNRHTIWPSLQNALQKEWELKRYIPWFGVQYPPESEPFKIRVTDNISRLADSLKSNGIDPHPGKDTVHLYTLTFVSPSSSPSTAAASSSDTPDSSANNDVDQRPAFKVPYIRDIYTAADVIFRVPPPHDALMYQMYWHIQAFVSLLEAHYAGSVIVKEEKDYQKWAGRLVQSSFFGLGGSRHISVLTPRGPDVSSKMEDIQGAFEERMERINYQFEHSNRAILVFLQNYDARRDALRDEWLAKRKAKADAIYAERRATALEEWSKDPQVHDQQWQETKLAEWGEESTKAVNEMYAVVDAEYEERKAKLEAEREEVFREIDRRR